jgi:hypothetical protein
VKALLLKHLERGADQLFAPITNEVGVPWCWFRPSGRRWRG